MHRKLCNLWMSRVSAMYSKPSRDGISWLSNLSFSLCGLKVQKNSSLRLQDLAQWFCCDSQMNLLGLGRNENKKTPFSSRCVLEIYFQRNLWLNPWKQVNFVLRKQWGLIIRQKEILFWIQSLFLDICPKHIVNIDFFVNSLKGYFTQK